MSSGEKPFRVLSLDGGGMRGIYTATYLDRVGAAFAKRRGAEALDIGGAFDLIVGTSTGAVIGCGLAHGVAPKKIGELYQEQGSAIFALPVPTGMVSVFADSYQRPPALATASAALRKSLGDVFGEETLAGVYNRRGIALAIPAVEMSQHRSWVFKTPHLAASSGRDDNYSLVDVCLASTAAPIFRSLTAIDHPDGESGGFNVFADGGLWANNPVLVGLVDALEMTGSGRRVEIFALGTCPYPAGEQLSKADLHRGLADWKFGGRAAELSIDAQEFAFDNMARMLARHVARDCEVVRFPHGKVPADLMQYLALDDARPEAALALMNQARTDADMTNSKCGTSTDREGQLICGLFEEMEAVSGEPAPDARQKVRSAS